jgi:hypothetical protein
MNCSGGCEKERLKLEVHRCGREADTLRPPNFLEAEERATGAIFGRRGSAVSHRPIFCCSWFQNIPSHPDSLPKATVIQHSKAAQLPFSPALRNQYLEYLLPLPNPG